MDKNKSKVFIDFDNDVVIYKDDFEKMLPTLINKSITQEFNPKLPSVGKVIGAKIVDDKVVITCEFYNGMIPIGLITEKSNKIIDGKRVIRNATLNEFAVVRMTK